MFLQVSYPVNLLREVHYSTRCTLLLGMLCTVSHLAKGQAAQEVDSLNGLSVHVARARQFEKVSIYAEAISEWQKAKGIADSLGLRREFFDVSISLAELMRKSQQFERGLEILTQLKGTEEFPSVHVRKLGRLAAVYHEAPLPDELNTHDSVKRYLDSGIVMAIQLDLPLEEASLKNELGYFISMNISAVKGISISKEAAMLFKLHGEDQNYVGAMTNILRSYIETDNLARADSIIPILLKEVEGKEWYDAEIELYRNIAYRYRVEGDSASQNHWDVKVTEAVLNWERIVNSQKMVMFRVLYDTEKYRDEAEKSRSENKLKEAQLELQTTRTRTMTILLLLLLVFVVAVAFFLLKERKLRRDMHWINQELQIANDKYHTLIVESNHRIKNNLQMILSMMQFASKDKNGKAVLPIKRMMSKIHTISALHKHLYSEVHNERVDLDTYFSEIVKLYTEMSAEELSIDKEVCSVGIKSERIVYFGLVLNEMLSNTLEHRIAKNDSIGLEVIELQGRYRFTYQDGSVINTENLGGTGTRLIRQLIKRVGGTQFLLDPTCGRYQFEFYA